MKSKVARKYRDKFPENPTRQLAKIMFEENKEMFRDIEDARSILRYIEGKNADGSRRKSVTDSKYFRTEPRPYNPYKLPESEETKWIPYEIKGVSKLAVLSDIHIPYHSISALTAALDYIQGEGCDGMLLNGDLIDFYGLSRFMKDPRKRSVAHELKATNDFLDVLQGLGLKIFYKLGNHDERFEHYMMQKAPELLGIQEFELNYLLKLKERGIELISEKRIVKVNKLNIIHGHEFVGGISVPVNVARGLYLRGKVSAMQGHNHSVSEHTEPNMNGEITTTWSTGCLCELNPAYMPINKWSHGFAIVDIDKNKKDFHVKNFRILNGKVL
jgi:predicted phosphodiesterase